MTEGVVCGWDANHREYVCADGTWASALNKTFRLSRKRSQENEPNPDVADPLVPKNGVLYQTPKRSNCLRGLFVAETGFNKRMSRIVRGSDAKTMTFPSTVRKVSDCAFQDAPLRSVVLNEGLKTLGECNEDWSNYGGTFTKTQI